MLLPVAIVDICRCGRHERVHADLLRRCQGLGPDATLRALGVSTPARLPAFPNIPTFAEQGFPSLAGSQWLGLSGPKGLPAPIAQRLTALVPEILAKPDIAGRLVDLQTLPRKEAVTGDEFVKLIKGQISTWTTVAKRAKVEVIV